MVKLLYIFIGYLISGVIAFRIILKRELRKYDITPFEAMFDFDWIGFIKIFPLMVLAWPYYIEKELDRMANLYFGLEEE